MAENVFGANIQLGRPQLYVDQYDRALLQSIERSVCRQQLPIKTFLGADIWTAFELSWLDGEGKPCVSVLELRVPADSTHIIESKSLKYYLNSFNQTRIESIEVLKKRLVADLSAAAGGAVSLGEFTSSAQMAQMVPNQIELDQLPLREPVYQRAPEVVQCGEQPVREVLCSHLLKTNCPVTGQPDWASIWIGYEGGCIDHASILAYIVSYRQHQDFHENCVEQIFCDLWQRCDLQRLWVYARYTRRGGLDINPFRSSHPMAVPSLRGFRQ